MDAVALWTDDWLSDPQSGVIANMDVSQEVITIENETCASRL